MQLIRIYHLKFKLQKPNLSKFYTYTEIHTCLSVSIFISSPYFKKKLIDKYKLYSN